MTLLSDELKIIVCPKCGHSQKHSSECIKCGTIFTKFKVREESNGDIPSKVKKVLEKSTLIKIWLYPGITIFLLLFGKILGFWVNVACLFITIIMIFFFGIGSLFNFVKGIINYIFTRDSKILKYLAAGFLLNGVLLFIRSWGYIEDYMYRQNIKKHNAALSQIREIHHTTVDLLADPAFNSLSEIRELEDLRYHSPELFKHQGHLEDPWGRPYGYRLQDGKPYIWSNGPDGLSGTDDDIDHKSRYRHAPYYHWPAA